MTRPFRRLRPPATCSYAPASTWEAGVSRAAWTTCSTPTRNSAVRTKTSRPCCSSGPPSARARPACRSTGGSEPEASERRVSALHQQRQDLLRLLHAGVGLDLARGIGDPVPGVADLLGRGVGAQIDALGVDEAFFGVFVCGGGQDRAGRSLVRDQIEHARRHFARLDLGEDLGGGGGEG